MTSSDKIRYEKVKFLDKPRSVFLRITGESARFLRGIEIDREGEEIEPPGYSQRIRVIDKKVILSRRIYVMDLHYGELVPAWKASKT